MDGERQITSFGDVLDDLARVESLERENAALREELDDALEALDRLRPWDRGPRDRRPVIALDFDGVLHDLDEWTGPVPEGQPLPGALESVQELLSRASIVIHSARLGSEAGWVGVRDWLDRHGFPVLPLSVGKPNAAIYVDDRGLYFDGWETALESILARL